MTTDADVREVLALEPCPFCGGGGLIRSYDDTWFASCDTCYCTVGENYDRAAMPAHLFETEEAAVAAWNRRATRETAKAEAGVGITDAAAKAEARREALEEAAKVADEFAAIASLTQKKAFDAGRDADGYIANGHQCTAQEIAAAIRAKAEG